MGITDKLKDKALSKTLNDPRVYKQVQKNTEKILKRREKESLLIVKAAVKELLDTKYEALIEKGIKDVMAEVKKEVVDAFTK